MKGRWLIRCTVLLMYSCVWEEWMELGCSGIIILFEYQSFSALAEGKDGRVVETSWWKTEKKSSRQKIITSVRQHGDGVRTQRTLPTHSSSREFQTIPKPFWKSLTQSKIWGSQTSRFLRRSFSAPGSCRLATPVDRGLWKRAQNCWRATTAKPNNDAFPRTNN